MVVYAPGWIPSFGVYGLLSRASQRVNGAFGVA